MFYECVLHGIVCLCVCICVSHVLLTWAGGAWGGRVGPSASTHQQSLLIFSQSLLRQVALPLDLQLQGFGDVWYDPVDGSQHEEHHMLEEERHLSSSSDCRTLPLLSNILCLNITS